MSFLVKQTGRKLFGKHLEQYTPQDPLYEIYIDKNGRQKRRKRAIPPGLSKRDIKVLQSVQSRAHHLDKSFNLTGCCCGCLPEVRFGWTFLIGLIPIIGDLAVFALHYRLIVHKARQADLPEWLVSKMVFHMLVSAGVGFVPFVGDVVAAMYKASSRNAALLQEFLRVRGEDYLKLEGAGAGSGVGGAPNIGSDVGAKAKKGGKLSKKDVEQVKPGAGTVEGEVIPSSRGASTSVTPPKE